MLFERTSMFLAGLPDLGLCSESTDLIVQVFHESGLLGNKDWDNVPLHCLRVAQVGQAIAKMVGYSGSEEIVLAGLLHDVCKHQERKRVASLMSRHGIGESEAFNMVADRQSTWLKKFGFRAETIATTRLSGHTSLQYFLSGQRNLEEKIFHLSDDLCGGHSGDRVVLLEERIEVLGKRYPFLSTTGQDVLGGQTYLEAQLKVSQQILQEVAEISGMHSGRETNVMLVMFLS